MGNDCMKADFAQRRKEEREKLERRKAQMRREWANMPAICRGEDTRRAIALLKEEKAIRSRLAELETKQK
jgi:hypothetical protein